MEYAIAGGALVLVGIIAAIVVVVLIIALIIAKMWIKVARSDEALVVSGKSKKSKDESSLAVIVNGKALVNPLTQRHEIISLRSRQVSMQAEAQSYDGVTLEVEAVAMVKIGSTKQLVQRAAERFASQDKAIEQFTTEQLEGALRGIVATLAVVSLMRDRKKFSDQIAADVSGELADQGLILDSFQIKGITDDLGYIASLGAPEVQSKRQAAEIAATNAERAIRKQQITNDEANLVEQTAYDTNEADSKAEVGQANARAEQAEALARVEARQDVLQQEAENKQAQLDADVKRVADAAQYEKEREADAKAYTQVKAAEAEVKIAESEAEAIRERAKADAESVQLAGEAKGAAIRAEAEALQENLEGIIAQRAIEILPDLMERFAQGYSRIGTISVIGSGSGSGSDSSPAGSQFSGESASAMRGVFESVKEATGVDLASVIQGRVTGSAIGEGMREPSPPSPESERPRHAPSTDATPDAADAADAATDSQPGSGDDTSVTDS
ncbi:SPFH domain-containing protein [Paramicrobacterium fandaimingii]|uniref:SPFH domain-containing protein n=1 Tax=Paramicrobacterium fandaimingii TaxID=2708079 RepID=UPI00189DE563|nr:SPFH domain-containing protein [Microbacterium fandaimingii]